MALLLSETPLKAIFYVHSSLRAGTSFLPFTVDVIGAISRVHHELSRSKYLVMCMGGVKTPLGVLTNH